MTTLVAPLRALPSLVLRRATVLALAAPVVLFAVLAWDRRWMAEDGFINVRVIENLLDGDGPVFNPGERVETSTSPLWVGVLAALTRIVRVPFSGVSVEWVAVILGFALAVAALVLAQVAAARVQRVHAPETLLLPFGALAVAVLPPFWDFATTGLETGLTYAWLSTCFLLLVRLGLGDADAGPRPRAMRVAAVTIGLGPLIRPDLGLFTVAFLAGGWVLLRLPRRDALVLLGWAAALPVAYQVFRMGYFASLVPNTALAKSFSTIRLEDGLNYVKNFASPYGFYVPVVLVLGALAWTLVRLPDDRERTTRVLALVPMWGGVVYLLYIVAVGGDFMHGRLLLPAVFAFLMPVAVLPARRVGVGLVAAMAVWAGVCAIDLRFHSSLKGEGIEDERSFWVNWSGERNPVALDDYHNVLWLQQGDEVRRAEHGHGGWLVIGPRLYATRTEAYDSKRTVVLIANIGLFGVKATPQVAVADRWGLADPIAARMLDVGGRVGHRKYMSDSWVVARFTNDQTDPHGTIPPDEIAAARRALGCPELQEMLEAVDRPLTVGRFLDNLVSSVRFTRMKIDPDPRRAAEECSGERPPVVPGPAAPSTTASGG